MKLFNGVNNAALSYHVSTRYKILSALLSKFSRSAPVFLWIFIFFFIQAISQNSSKPVIVKGFFLFRMPNSCCFLWAAQGQLTQCNRNIVTVLRTVVKSHKRNISICLWMFWKKSQKFLKVCREEPVVESFHCKVAACHSF